jgi:hypothetical protein
MWLCGFESKAFYRADGVGVGESTLTPSAQSLIADTYSKRELPTPDCNARRRDSAASAERFFRPSIASTGAAQPASLNSFRHGFL